jgi:hypothetical protein
MTLKFRATIENGKFNFSEPSKFRDHVAKFSGQEIAVSVTKWRKPRSDNQNSYYWGCVIELLSEHSGYTPDEMHEALKQLFLTDKTLQIPKVKSTTDLNTLEFEEFLSKVRIWASVELQVNIPFPREYENQSISNY